MSGNRTIFEEVPTSEKQRPVTAGLIDRGRGGAPRAMRLWLMVIFALLVLMIAVGGITRLTDSGLSITEWKPLSGALPPMSEAQWQNDFNLYQQTDEYRLQNSGMTIDEYRSIFWWEWAHRQLGRIIGLVWALGFMGFAVARMIPAGWAPRLLLLGALGGLQGIIGWWMVSSGLRPGMLDVASTRLAVHLGLAFGILGLISWYILRLGRPRADLLQARRAREQKLWGMTTGLLHLAFLQILLGALVAGIDAGRAYPTWPLMNDGFLPPDPFVLSPIWRNLIENAGLVQFMHRMTAYLLFAFGIVVFLRGRKSGNAATRRAYLLLVLTLGFQVMLGIVTLVHASPLPLALAHQITAVALLVFILRARFQAGYPVTQSVRGTS